MGVQSNSQLCSTVTLTVHLATHAQVECDMRVVPTALCELSRLQLLNLSQNQQLQNDGYSQLTQAPLHKMN